MEIYSPKAKNAGSFKKNTKREDVLAVDTILEKKETKNIKSEKTSMLDFVKMKFYERMTFFFDYEEKIKDKTTSKSNYIENF